MAGIRGHFDCEGFYRALDHIRDEQKLTWKQIGGLSKVSASTLTRMAQGKRPDADSLAMLSAWSSLNPADFVFENVTRSERSGGGLNQILTYLRADPNLSKPAITALDEIITTAYRHFEKNVAHDDDTPKGIQKRSRGAINRASG